MGSIPGQGTKIPPYSATPPKDLKKEKKNWTSLVAHLVENLPATWETWRRERLPTPVCWPGEFHGLYRPRGGKELDTTEQLSHSIGCG